MIYLITGLPGTGKTSAAKRLFKALGTAILLDGDTVRRCWPHLGYSKQDREFSTDHVFTVAKAFHEAGEDVVISIVCPIARARDKFHEEFKEQLIEIRLETVFRARPSHYYCEIEESKDYPPHIVRWEGFEKLIQGVVK